MIRWTCDPRPATALTRLYVAVLRRRHDDQAFTGARHTEEVALRKQERGDHPPNLTTRVLAHVRPGPLGGLTGWTCEPRFRRPRVRVLHLHGGGYVHPLTPDYWRLARALARGRAQVVVPAYPLAPRHTLDDVLPSLVDLVRSHDDLPWVLSGDSAGGALVLTLAQALRDSGGPRPARVLCLSPWLDARLDEDEVADLDPTDPVLAPSGLRAAGRWWAGSRSTTDPWISPANASLHGLPPIDLHVGGRDILRPAVDRLVDAARRDRADLHVHEVPAMFHVWMTRPVPEGARTRRTLTRTVRLAALPAASGVGASTTRFAGRR